MLWVHQRGVAVSDPEEGRIEQVDTVHHAVSADVVVVFTRRGIDARRDQVAVGDINKAILAAGHPRPQLVDVGRAREASRHTDDGDVGFGKP